MDRSSTQPSISLQELNGMGEASISPIDQVETPPQDAVIQRLKPTDGGIAAWRVLLAAFLFEALLWGFPVCFGVFQEYYSTLPEFEGNNHIALIGTISQGLCYIGAPASAAVTKLFSKYQCYLIWMGWPLCILGLGLGSISSHVGALVATQGVMYGIGFVTLYWPIISILNEWWVVRKGFAFGVVASAGGASGAIMPFIFQALLKRYGYKITLRATAISMTILTGPLIPFFKARIPPSEQSTLTKMNWTFIKKPLFWVYCLSTTVQGLGFFLPPLFLPSYAVDIGLSSTLGALLLSAMAISQFLGQFTFGYVSDRDFSITLLAIFSSIMTTLASFLVWGMAKSLPLLLVFSIVYGFFGYGFFTIRIGMGRMITRDPTSVVPIQSIFIFCVGVGNILTGPISAKMVSGQALVGGYGAEKYKDAVIFTGSCMLGSVLVLGLAYLGPKKWWVSAS